MILRNSCSASAGSYVSKILTPGLRADFRFCIVLTLSSYTSKAEVRIFETWDPAEALQLFLRIILSYSAAPCMVWLEPQFDSYLSQKHPFFRLWEFLENSRGPPGGKSEKVFCSARRVLPDGVVSLVTKNFTVVEISEICHSRKGKGKTAPRCQSASLTIILYR